MFEVSDRKKSRAIATLCAMARLEGVWTHDGPTDRGRQLREDARDLAPIHRKVLNAAWALHDGSTSLRVAELWELDRTYGEALSDLILALSEGDRSLERWIGRYAQSARSHTHRLELDGAAELQEVRAKRR